MGGGSSKSKKAKKQAAYDARHGEERQQLEKQKSSKPQDFRQELSFHRNSEAAREKAINKHAKFLPLPKGWEQLRTLPRKV